MELSPKDALGPNSYPIHTQTKGKFTATVYAVLDEYTVLLTKNDQVVQNITTDDREEAFQTAAELVKKAR